MHLVNDQFTFLVLRQKVTKLIIKLYPRTKSKKKIFEIPKNFLHKYLLLIIYILYLLGLSKKFLIISFGIFIYQIGLCLHPW